MRCAKKAGVFNIGLEGFVLTGAFCAVVGAFFFGSPWMGALAAMAGGVVMALIFAEFHLRRPGDPIVVSIAINILAAGLTIYLLSALFGISGAFRDPAIRGFEMIHIPIIRDIPVIGQLFSGQSILYYLSLVVAVLMSLFFAHHRLGLRNARGGREPGGTGGRRGRSSDRAALRADRLRDVVRPGRRPALDRQCDAVRREHECRARLGSPWSRWLLTRGKSAGHSGHCRDLRLGGQPVVPRARFRCPAAIYRHDALSRDTCRADRAVLVAQVAPGPILGDPT